MAIPGTRGTVYTADGLEHSEAGIPSSQSRDHRAQLDKRERKLTQHDYGRFWADVEGDGDAAVITFGSTTAAAREAVGRARARGVAVRLVALRLLAPAQPAALAAALAGRGAGAGRRAEPRRPALPLPALDATTCRGRPASFRRPGPLPLRPGELASAIVDWAGAAVAQGEPA